MSAHRSQRLAEAIREVVATAILFEVADPRVRAVTVLRTELSGDLRNATVFVTIMGTPNEQRTAMNGLRSATGFLQARVAARLQTRFTPVLAFKLDDSVKKSVEISRMIDQALASDRRDDPAEEATEADLGDASGPTIGGPPSTVEQSAADLDAEEAEDDEDEDEEDDDEEDHDESRRPPTRP